MIRRLANNAGRHQGTPMPWARTLISPPCATTFVTPLCRPIHLHTDEEKRANQISSAFTARRVDQFVAYGHFSSFENFGSFLSLDRLHKI
jgi:hypothetical protein